MFDVDCPRTPDEDNKDGAPTSAAKKVNNNHGKPPIVRRNPSAAKVSSRSAANDVSEEGVEVSLTTSSATNQYTPRSNKSKQLFSPRQRGGKGSSNSTRRGNGHRYKSSNKVGLEPEEFIISKPKANALPPRPTQQTAPPRTPNAPHTPGNNRGHKVIQPNSSDGASVNMSQLNLTQQQDTLDNNRSAHHMNNRPRTHSTEAFGPNNIEDDDDEEDIVGAGIGGSNPFDGDTIDGGGRYIGPPIKKKKPTTMSMNTRSNSRGYWTEEIIDEEDDKGTFYLLFVYFCVTS